MFRLAPLVFLLLILIACKAPADKSSSSAATTADSPVVRIETEGSPKLGISPILVYILDKGEGVSGAKVKLIGDMTHAGMVPVLSEALETEKGLYRADDFAFTMAGDWIISAEIELADGKKLRSDKALSVVR